jgi:hypothetical protein
MAERKPTFSPPRQRAKLAIYEVFPVTHPALLDADGRRPYLANMLNNMVAK